MAKPVQKAPPPAIPNHQRPTPVLVQQSHQLQMPIPPGEMLDKLKPHIENVGERWMALMEGNVAHQRSMETESLKSNVELQKMGLGNQQLAIKQDGNNIRRGQWIAGGLIVVICGVFAGLIFVAYKLFMADKALPAAAFTGLATALAWGFRSIVMGYLGKPEGKK